MDWFLPALCAAIAAVRLARMRSRLLGTTLVAPWWWAVAAMALVAGVELAAAICGSAKVGWIAAARLIAATSTLCLTMSLLGARRPQHRPWQAIVFSLWVVVLLPAAEAWLIRPADVPELHPLRRVFVAALICLGVGNYLPTRFWLAALLWGAGQTILLWEALPVSTLWADPPKPVWGLACLSAALLATAWPRRRRSACAVDRVWVDFRDAFGAVWALRVQDRLNAAARQHGWPVMLAWSGLVEHCRGPTADPRQLEPPDRAAAERAMTRSLAWLLRRFVSPAWIDARLDAGAGRSADSLAGDSRPSA
jgi:hypothetical protein